jgi:hypothetical protein
VSALIDPALAVVRNYALHTLARKGANSRATVESIALTIEELRSRARIHVDYTIALNPAEDCREIYFDCMRCPFPLLECLPGDGATAFLPAVHASDPGGGLVRIRLEPGFDRPRLCPRITLEWPRSSSFPNVLTAPDMIPMLLRSARAGSGFQAVLSVAGDLPPNYNAAGVGRMECPGTFFQIHAAPCTTVWLTDDGISIRATDAVSRSTSWIDRATIAHDIATMTRFLREIFGSCGPQDVLLVAASDFARPVDVAAGMANGSCVLLAPGQSRHFNDYAAFHAARTLAGMWWPCGCRIHGRNASEYQRALTGAVALLQRLHATDQSSIDALCQRLRTHASRKRRTDWWSRMQGRVRLGSSISLSLALFDAMIRELNLVTSVGNLTRAHWGRWIDTETVVRTLERANALEKPFTPG